MAAGGGAGRAVPLVARAQVLAENRPLNEAEPADLAEGKRLYGAQCALCHGMDGSGGYGPSLLVPVLARASDDRGLLRSWTRASRA